MTIGTWKFWKDTWERKFRMRICTYLPVTWLRTKLTSTTSLMTTLKETLKISLDTIFSLNVPEWKRYAECTKLFLVELFLSLASILVKCGIISAFTMWQKVLFLMKICGVLISRLIQLSLVAGWLEQCDYFQWSIAKCQQISNNSNTWFRDPCEVCVLANFKR